MLEYPASRDSTETKCLEGKMFFSPSFEEFDPFETVRKTVHLSRELMTVSKGPSEAVLHPEALLNPLVKNKKRWLDSENGISFPCF